MEEIAVTGKPSRAELKYWVVTVFGDYLADKVTIDPMGTTLKEKEQWFARPDIFQYSIFGREICPTSGKPHLQGFVAFIKPRRFSALKEWFPKGARYASKAKKATPLQAATYCKKDNDFVELGTLPEAQHYAGNLKQKETWEQAYFFASTGNFEEIHPQILIQNYTTLKKIRNDNRPIPPQLNHSDKDTPNEWHYGATGTGKSTYARTHNDDIYLKMNNKWWENYEDEDVVLIEDVGKTHLWMGDFLKIWGDRYAFRNEQKFGSLVLRPKKIIVTSNYSPKDLWPEKEIYAPLERRFKLIYHQIIEEYVQVKLETVDVALGIKRSDNKWCIIHGTKPCICTGLFLCDSDVIL